VPDLRDAQLPSLFDRAAAAAAPALGAGRGAARRFRSSFDQIHGLHLVISRRAASRRLIIAVDDVR
jgi:hypothetical protein